MNELAVNSEKEANWLIIQRKRRDACQFEERVNRYPMIINPTSVSQKQFPQNPTPSPFLSFFSVIEVG